jgi:hypothetical protein
MYQLVSLIFGSFGRAEAKISQLSVEAEDHLATPQKQFEDLAHEPQPAIFKRSTMLHSTPTDDNFITFRPIREDLPQSIASTILSDQSTTSGISTEQSIASTSSFVSDFPPTPHEMFQTMFPGIDFDFSVLEALDEQLIYNPMHSFAATCWSEAVQDPEVAEPESDFPISYEHQDSDDAETIQSDDTATPREEDFSQVHQKSAIYLVSHETLGDPG